MAWHSNDEIPSSHVVSRRRQDPQQGEDKRTEIPVSVQILLYIVSAMEEHVKSESTTMRRRSSLYIAGNARRTLRYPTQVKDTQSCLLRLSR